MVSSDVVGQGVPSVVTLNTGVQFEGETFSLNSIRGAVDPNGNKRIAAVNDGIRRIFFRNDLAEPHRRIINVSPSNRNESEMVTWQRSMEPSINNGYGALLYVGPFNSHGRRLLRYRDADGVWEVTQGITLVNPRWCELRSIKFPGNKRERNWTMRVATGTIPPDTLRDFLRSQIRRESDPAEYLNIVDFYIQAEQFTRADEELNFIMNKFPDLRERIEQDRQTIRQALAQQWLRTIRDHLDAGQPELASQMLAAMNPEGLATEIQAEVNQLYRQSLDRKTAIEQSQKMIAGLVDAAHQSGKLDDLEKRVVDQFKEEIDRELNPENVARLDAARQFLNDQSMSISEKVSLAISGWMLGTNNASRNFAVTSSLPPVRELVREYLSTADRARRGEIIGELASYEGGAPQYVAPLISQMLPVKPPENLADYTGEKPIEFTVTVKGSKMHPEPRNHRVHVHLPPEYNPYRRYPCIITLPNDTNLERQMGMWCGSYNPKLGIRTGQATRHGYIVVGIDWKLPNQNEYNYSKREHAVALKAYRTALRMFSIDTDRVFITGHGVGGDMAYDIGSAHPEHWAGIVGISGKIAKYAYLYNDNRHVRLPVYCVMGDKDLASLETSGPTLDKWLGSPRYNETVLVMYKGRVNEPFTEEIVEIFKWTNAQRRKLPTRSGFEFEVESLRAWDNYFWFWEMRGLPDEKLEAPQLWKDRGHPRAFLISGEIKDNQSNTIRVGPPNGGAGGTLWLSPEFVDFSQPLTILGRGKTTRVPIFASTAIMLEDVRRRADRQHPFWSKIECDGTSWEEQ